MASASAASRVQPCVPHPRASVPAVPGHSKSHDSPLTSHAPGPADMGNKFSKPGRPHADSGVGRKQAPPPDAGQRRSKPPPLTTAYSSKPNSTVQESSSICRSPTWSPRGSLAARTQVEKEKRDQERELRKEAEEAKKRLKEFKESQRRKSDQTPDSTSGLKGARSTAPAEAQQSNKLQKREAKRLSKQPPPAAMETQRLPKALQAEPSRVDQSHSSGKQPDEKRRSRRSSASSFSGMLRMVTGRSRSSSRTRRGGTSDDDPYLSDASTRSHPSFVGGIKLREQEKIAAESRSLASSKTQASPVIEPVQRPASRSFADDVQTRFDKITGRSTKDIPGMDDNALTKEESPEVNANMGRRRSQKLNTDQTPDVDNGKRRQSLTEHLRSSREASLNRMQNLVTPLRSAMKGSREIAKNGRSQSMPLAPAQPASPKEHAPQPSAGPNYVSRARLHSQSRSLAGYQDEMAVKEANDAANARALEAAEAEIRVKEAAAAATATEKQKYGPLLPPTPDESVNDSNTPRPSHDTANPSAQEDHSRPDLSRHTRHPAPAPGVQSNPPFVWSHPIKANKYAAAERLLQKGETPRDPSAIDKLPSQIKARRPSDSPALKPARSLQGTMTAPSAETIVRNASTHDQDSFSATSPLSSDDDGQGLRRHPAVMSWRAEKNSPLSKFAALPRATIMPIIMSSHQEEVGPLNEKPIQCTLRPEDHPSLAALRSGGSPAPVASHESGGEIRHDYADPIDRPFSIVPTPVASPAPSAQPVRSQKPIKAPSDPKYRAKQAASKALDTLKAQQASQQRTEEVDDSASVRAVISPKPIRRHSTPPAELAGTASMTTANSKSKLPAPSSFPFPDRHEPLVKPSDKRASTSKVSFHTPPESPRFLSASTSYDSYRRSNTDLTNIPVVVPGLDIDDDVQLPIPVDQLGRPNPPFAREQGPYSRRSSSSNLTSRQGRSPAGRRASSDDKKGYVYVDFSSAGSSSTLSVAHSEAPLSSHTKKIPRGFIIKNADGLAMDPIAKMFVVCCGCRKWHDVPSSIYREMARGLREIDLKEDGVAEAKVPKHGEKQKPNLKKRRSGVISTVPCCWCKHEMSVLCCEGWSSLCYMSAQYHQVGQNKGREAPGLDWKQGRGRIPSNGS